MIESHVNLTGSDVGRRLLADWDTALPKFVKVFPRAYRRVLEQRAQQAAAAAAQHPATHDKDSEPALT